MKIDLLHIAIAVEIAVFIFCFCVSLLYVSAMRKKWGWQNLVRGLIFTPVIVYALGLLLFYPPFWWLGKRMGIKGLD